MKFEKSLECEAKWLEMLLQEKVCRFSALVCERGPYWDLSNMKAAVSVPSQKLCNI